MSQFDLFGGAGPVRLDLGTGWVEHHRGWLSPVEAEALFAPLRTELPWESRTWPSWNEETIVMPRLETFCGDPNLSYTYSGRNTYTAKPWHPLARVLRDKLKGVDSLADVTFNAAFCNLYRGGSDSIGWHADDERNLGPRWPVDVRIASVSLGDTRRFRLRRKDRSEDKAYSWDLAHGDLLVMGGAVQRDYEHCVPKTSRQVGSRVNLTFRVVSP